MKMKNKNIGLGIFILLLLVQSCKQESTPRPYGYFRIDFPNPQYELYDDAQSFLFEKPLIANIEHKAKDSQLIGIDIIYPENAGYIHCSYLPVNNDLQELLSESHAIVYKHSIRADNISERAYENPENNTFGILYELSGNVASPIQFVMTDSVKHFFRGSLYFETTPNNDSIQPVIDYIREDIIHIMESFKWK